MLMICSSNELAQSHCSECIRRRLSLRAIREKEKRCVTLLEGYWPERKSPRKLHCGSDPITPPAIRRRVDLAPLQVDKRLIALFLCSCKPQMQCDRKNDSSSQTKLRGLALFVRSMQLTYHIWLSSRPNLQSTLLSFHSCGQDRWGCR